MTKFLVKKISFSTYVKIAALFGASIGLLFTTLFVLMIPMLLLSSEQGDLLIILPVFLFAPLLFILPFGLYGVISYPFYLLACKVLKKFTLEVELIPIEEQTQPEETPANKNSEF